MGFVYEARDPAVGRRVAVKTIRPEQLDRPDAGTLVERFQREAKAAGALSHPNIVGVYDVGDRFLVMELVEGVDLSRYLVSHGPLALTEALAFFSEVADAIDTAHAGGVIHRDLKPSNIMVQPDGRPKLMDFGIARLESGASTRTGELLGSPSYMAPEQIAGEATDGRTDLFALAVVMYEALTGERPFQGDTITTIIYRVINEPAPSLRHWRPELPAALDEVFDRALGKEPERRFSSARELIAAIASAASGASTPGAYAVPAPPADAAPGRAGPDAAPSAPAPVGVRRHHAATLTLDLGARFGRRGRIAATLLAGLGTLAAALLLWPASPRRVGSAPGDPVSPAAGLNRLTVETSPAGARVEIDGALVGETPIVADVEPGEHRIRLSRDGYAPVSLRLDVPDGEPAEPLFFDLMPVVARIEVTSDPAGAEVFVEAEKIGVTPFAGDVPPGRLDILVNMPGVGAWRRTVTAEAGETLRFHAVLRAASPAGPGADGVWEVGAGVTAPVRIAGAPAPFPERAARADLEGSVTVDMVVTEEGMPSELEVAESGGPVLDAAVLEAIAGWRFEPAMREGEPVRVRWRVRQDFRQGR